MHTKSVYTAVLFFCWQVTALASMLFLIAPWSIVTPVLLSVVFGGAVLWLWSTHAPEDVDADQYVLDAIRQLDETRVEASKDPLTGLRSRPHIQERLNETLAVAMERQHKCAVLMMDLDFFKDINETLGYPLGNQLLSAIGERLYSVVKKGDLLGYYGADEFIVVLPEIQDPMAAEVVARRLLSALFEPFEVRGHALSISASIGIAIGPQDGTEGEALIRQAESALTRMKAKGRKGYRFFTQSMNRAASDRLEVDRQLRGALQRDEFSLVYQPIMDSGSRQVTGVEALIRWHNPELGQVAPERFIAIAEQTGVIGDIGDWVLNQAAIQVLAWQTRYQRSLLMSVNVSPRQFRDGRLMQRIKAIAVRLGLNPGCLQLEVTERLLMNASQRQIEDLTLLKRAGVQLALDDFGTGYSSLSSLRSLPFDMLKIDQRFVHEINGEPEGDVMAETMTRIGHSLGMKVVAEGVETDEQNTSLSRLSVDNQQGFLFSQPVSPGEFEQRFLAASAG